MSTMPVLRRERGPRRSGNAMVVQIQHLSKGRLAQHVDRVTALENLVMAAIRPFTLPALRIALGMLFVWFGALKVAGASPVAAIVSGTLPWADPGATVVVLGGVELVLRDGNPLLLTESGEFVVKNLVLIGATLVLMVHTRAEARPSAAQQTSSP